MILNKVQLGFKNVVLKPNYEALPDLFQVMHDGLIMEPKTAIRSWRKSFSE